MNKGDISAIRRELKTDSVYLRINQVYTVYLKSDNKRVIHKGIVSWGTKEENEQEIYIDNFKKLLTGGIDAKIFELDFAENDSQGQKILFNCLTENTVDKFMDYANEIVAKIADNCNYETDVVINFMKADFNKPAKKKKRYGEVEDLDGADDTSYGFSFIMCTVNKVATAKKVLKYDFSEMQFVVTSAADIVVNTSSPIEGFMFPAFNCDSSDVNKVMYYTSKVYQRNNAFVEKILNCRPSLSAKEEKEKFEQILKSVVGDEISSQTMKGIYEKIDFRIQNNESDEPVSVGVNEVKRILENSGVSNTDNLQSVFEEEVGKNYAFKAINVIPSYNSRSIKIDTSTANILVSPKDLGALKQVTDSNGRKCLLIQVNEDVLVNGIALIAEKI